MDDFIVGLKQMAKKKKKAFKTIVQARNIEIAINYLQKLKLNALGNIFSYRKFQLHENKGNNLQEYCTNNTQYLTKNIGAKVIT